MNKGVVVVMIAITIGIVLAFIVIYEPWAGSPVLGDGFTGVKVYADSGVNWNGQYWVHHDSDIRSASFSGSGNNEYTIVCPSGYTMQVTISVGQSSTSYDLAAESWVRGELRERNEGSFSIMVTNVC